MPQYDNELTFVLFPNKNKKTDKHPTLTGTATVDGVEYFADAWVNESPNGKRINGKLKRKDKQPEERTQSGFDRVSEMDDSEIPF